MGEEGRGGKGKERREGEGRGKSPAWSSQRLGSTETRIMGLHQTVYISQSCFRSIHCKRKILKLSLKKYSVTGAYIEYDILKFSMHEYSIFAQSE